MIRVQPLDFKLNALPAKGVAVRGGCTVVAAAKRRGSPCRP